METRMNIIRSYLFERGTCLISGIIDLMHGTLASIKQLNGGFEKLNDCIWAAQLVDIHSLR